MFAVLFLTLVVCSIGTVAGLLSGLAVWFALIFRTLDLLVQQVPRGVMLFLRLAGWIIVRAAKFLRWLYLNAKRGGVWAARNAYARLFVWSYCLREWYVTSELRRRKAG